MRRAFIKYNAPSMIWKIQENLRLEKERKKAEEKNKNGDWIDLSTSSDEEEFSNQEITESDEEKANNMIKSALQKIHDMNEKSYWEEIKKNKPYHYSLKKRRAIIAEKTIEAHSEALEYRRKFLETCAREYRKEFWINPEDNSDTYAREWENYFMDDINKEIRDSILTNTSEPPESTAKKRLIFGLEEEYPDDFPEKRFKSDKNVPAAPENNRKIFKSGPREIRFDPKSVFNHKETEPEPPSGSKVLTNELQNNDSSQKSVSDNKNLKVSTRVRNKENVTQNKKSNFRRLNMRKKFFSRKKRTFNRKRSQRNKPKMTKSSANEYEYEYEEIDDYVSDMLECEISNTDIKDSQMKYFENIDDPELDSLVTNSLKDFGLENFRTNQELVIKRILCGKSTMLISPTGFGKSLCYQLAAYCFSKLNKSITIVISPLISLMQDQLRNLPKCLKGVCYNSSQTIAENADAIKLVIDGRAQIIFLSPEFLVNGFYATNFQSLPPIAFVCIDEAHCMVEWSTNFRPTYFRLYEALKSRLKVNTILAMTATASQHTLKLISENLKLELETDIIGQTKIPENLVLAACRPMSKLEYLYELLTEEKYSFKSLKSIIIYCTKRETTESVAVFIRAKMFPRKEYDLYPYYAEAYHAGLTSIQRKSIQSRFLKGELRIVVATLAFGMGINHDGVQGIIHYDIPRSFENYVQEIGRAGRNGDRAYCHLILDYHCKDIFTLEKYICADTADKKNIRDFVRKVYQPCAHKRCYEGAREDGEEAEQGTNIFCQGHPVALPIKQTELEVDIKSEVLDTLLLEMQKMPDFPIKVSAPINSTCHFINFGDDKIRKLVEEDLILKLALFLLRPHTPTIDKNDFEFSIVEVARVLGKEVSEIRNHLRNLAWDQKKNKPNPNIGIRFTNKSFLVHAPGTLSNRQICRITDYLHQKMIEREEKELNKLKSIYHVFKKGSLIQDLPQNIEDKSNELKSFLDKYFNDKHIESEFLKQFECYIPNFEIDEESISLLKLSIKSLVEKLDGLGMLTLSRTAKILAGISSPQYPEEKIVRRVPSHWRSALDVNYRQLLELCRECIRDYYKDALANK